MTPELLAILKAADTREATAEEIDAVRAAFSSKSSIRRVQDEIGYWHEVYSPEWLNSLEFARWCVRNGSTILLIQGKRSWLRPN
jgi:hypothetical protein